MHAPSVTVEVHLANGLPCFTLVGLADTEVKEARERVRCAMENAGLAFPNNKRITVNLGPADLPKDSGRFDLPIALGILSAQGLLDDVALAQHEFAGELSLSGELRPVRGALAMGLAMHDAKVRARLVLPPISAQEAALVPTMEVYCARHLQDVVAEFAKPGVALFAKEPSHTTSRPISIYPSTTTNGKGGDTKLLGESSAGWQRVLPSNFKDASRTQSNQIDLSDVKGQATPKRALEIASAAGTLFY